jgi:hypothetical protein
LKSLNVRELVSPQETGQTIRDSQSSGGGDPYDEEDDDEDASDHISAPAGHVREISNRTIQQYKNMIQSMRRSFLADSPEGSEELVAPVELVDHLLSRVKHLRPKTFINYRCALLYWMNTLPASSDIHHAKLLLEVGVPKFGYKSIVGPKSHKSTKSVGNDASLYSRSSSRARTFEKKHFERLIHYLGKLSSKRESPGRGVKAGSSNRPHELMLWLKSGLASGLRPAEWEFAKWEDRSRGVLLVKNAKKKVGTYALPHLSSHPVQEQKFRRVNILPDDQIWVEQHLESVRRHLLSGEPFSKYYTNNRIYLNRACQDLFGSDREPLTLYMMRGQFGANLKRSGMPLDEVAITMGCSPNVSSGSYGKKKHGHRSGQREKVAHRETDMASQEPKSPLGSQAPRSASGEGDVTSGQS